jgi:hypothetical protein
VCARSCCWSRSRAWSRAARAAGLALVAAAAAYWNRQHNPALPRGLATYIERVDEGFSLPALYKLWGRFVGRLNWNSRGLPGAAYALSVVTLALAGLGSFAALLRGRDAVRRPVLLLSVAALVAQAALVFLRGVPEGRYLVPAVPALGVVLAAGLVAPWPAALRPRAALALAAALVVFDAVYLWRGVALHHYLVWGA